MSFFLIHLNNRDTAAKFIKINVVFRRITVNEALAHEYLHQYYDPEDEPVSEQPFRFDEEFDNYNRERLRNMIFAATDPSHFRQADRMEQ